MAYKLRDRNQKRIYFSTSSSDSDSSYSDPDYSGSRPPQRPQNQATNIQIGSSSLVRRRGRPIKRRVYGGENQSFEVGESSRGRKQAPCSLKKQNTSVGKRQEKTTILSWLIDLGIIRENAEVWYLEDNRVRILLRGMIRRAGIFCLCCKEEITVWEFEIHAASDLKRPYANIFLAWKLVSLFQCQLEACIMVMGPNQCGFNQVVPKENAVDRNDDAYHWACSLEEDLDLNTPIPSSLSNQTLVNSFCGKSCREIFKHLESIAGVRNEIDGGLSWSLMRLTDLRSATPTDNIHQIVECNCKIGIVWGMMDESFVTTMDRLTNINIVRSVVYNQGSNLARINFQRFYTAVLEKDDEIVSAACLRIHGTKVAEIPFVTTHENYREMGMWRKLLVAIESALHFLKVEYLVIPSIDHLVPMWTKKFGFSKVKGSLMNELIFLNTLMFTKAVRLQKTLLPAHSIEPDGGDNGGKDVDGVSKQKEQNGTSKGRNLGKLPLFDLNVEPTEEGR
ncbi:increased DNA methylation 1-like [Juglans microcarpa x Juglans regia]|uniref:increased DNA methylation 1-like n=1 Tax=Juglans microcarpa x Juglans regia TaxID=2249226 RepID=UPI001B7F4417|nr:increased DNA methylation 1-like [Juglans microcarpa x Juglans regia]